MIIKVEPEIIRGFVSEVESYLPKLVASLEQFWANPERVESLEEAYRMVHCIRGAGSTIGLYALSQLAQYQEDALEQVLSGELLWSEDVASFLTSATMRIGDYLHGMTSGEFTERSIVTDLVKASRRLRNLPVEGDDKEIDRLLGEPAQIEAPVETVSAVEQPDGSSISIQTLDDFTVDDELWNTFQEEASEHFRILAEGLNALASGSHPTTLNALRRCAHQLKGASGVVGMLATSKLNAAMQKVLDRILEGEAVYSPDLLPLFQSTFEVVLESIGGKGTGADLADRARAVEAEYERLLAAPAHRPQSIPAPGDLVPAASDHLDSGEDLREAFHQEADETLTAAGDVLRSIRKQAPTQDQIQSLRRSIHTFKVRQE